MGATLLSLGVVGACSSKSTNNTPLFCQDDDSALCSGADGCQGTRECLDGEWTDCVCGSTTSGAGGGDTTTSTTSTTSGDSTASGGSTSTMAANTSGGTGGGVGAGDATTSATTTAGAGGSSGGTGGATTTGGSGGGSAGSVRGTVVNHWRHPVAGVTVMVGEQETTTDGDGAFQFEAVPESYDVMLDLTYSRYGSTGRYGWVYQGVTRRDPTLQVYGGLDLRQSNVLVMPTNVTDEEELVVAMALGGDYGRYLREGATSSNSMLSYFGPAEVTMYGHALSWVETDGLPTDYIAYDSTPLLAFDSAVADPVTFSADLSETDLTSGTISGSVTSPTSDARRNAVYVRFASNALIQVVKDSSAIDGSFAYTVPSLPDASVLVAAHEGDLYDGPRAVAYRNGLNPGETNVALEIPAPATLNAPGAAAPLADDTVFSWSSDAQTFLWMFWSQSVNEGLFVVTAQEELTIPTFPNGLDLVRPGDDYAWRVETHGSADSVDAMLGAQGFMGDFNDIAYDEPDGPGAGSGNYTASGVRGVTTVE